MLIRVFWASSESEIGQSTKTGKMPCLRLFSDAATKCLSSDNLQKIEVYFAHNTGGYESSRRVLASLLNLLGSSYSIIIWQKAILCYKPRTAVGGLSYSSCEATDQNGLAFMNSSNTDYF